MPLSAPAFRRLYHNRVIRCIGYRRDDGLWDIEGHLIDTKSYAYPNDYRGKILPGEPLHDMWLRITIDDDLLIHDVEACIDQSPFAVCAEITGRFSQLIGLRIVSGWNRKIHELLGGTQGCTHLLELLRPMATTALQTIYDTTRDKPKPIEQSAQDIEKPVILDSCHALSSDSAVVKLHWPQFYSGKD